MEVIFLKLVNMSITASWLALAVMAVRLLFRKTPKWITCLLWGLVALRLICPFSIESALSLIPSPEPLPQEIVYTAQPEIHSGIPAVDAAVNPVLETSLTPVGHTSANPTQILSFVCSRIWIMGMGLMLLYTLVSYLLLKRRVCTAIPLEKGVKQSEFVDSPFVLGIFRPVIYLPFGLAEGDLAYVLAHERAHIRRHDHWWKPAGFLLLSVYWFNPVMWIAYLLLCRDIEAACDEKVICNMETDDRRAYSTALLNCSVHRRRIAACPIAFGEVGVKARIQNVMNYKKPAFWVVLIALLIGIVVAVCFLTNPKQPDSAYEMTSTLGLEDVEMAQAMLWEGEEEARILLTEEQTRELVRILNTLEEPEFEKSAVGIREKSVLLSLGKGDLLLSYDGTRVVLLPDAEGETAWAVGNDGLNAFFGSMEMPDWGITVSVEDVTPEQANMRFFQNGESVNGYLHFDGEYKLQVWAEAGWTDVQVQTDSSFPATDTEILRKCSFGQTIFWEDRYSELSPGNYRIVKYIRLRDVSGFEEYCPYYGEFTIAEPDLETSGIVCVDLCYQKCYTSLSAEEEYSPIVSMLEEIQANARTVSEAEVSDQVADSFHTHSIYLRYAESEQGFGLSKDCSLLWTEDVGDKQIYSLEDFPQLEEYLIKMTDGVRREETSGTPFATKDEPWNWTKNLSGGEVEQASIYVLQETVRGENSISQTVSSGTFSAERFAQMLEILNAIPREAFSEGKLPFGVSPTYSSLCTQLGNRGISIAILDQVNSLAVVFRYQDSGVEMAMWEDVEKAEDGANLKDMLTYWEVSDPVLTQYMQDLMEDPPIITYLVGSGYEWGEPVEFAYGAYSLTLQMMEGWDYQITEGAPNAESFGVRCRPGDVCEGWFYFSFWPGGYEPQEENRWYGEGMWMGYPSIRSYPDPAVTEASESTQNAIWSYYRARTDNGDFAVINEGADAWFPEYQEAINNIISLCRFSVDG